MGEGWGKGEGRRGEGEREVLDACRMLMLGLRDGFSGGREGGGCI